MDGRNGGPVGRAGELVGLKAASSVARVAAWLADDATSSLLACSGVATAWTVDVDTDGAVLLLPQGDHAPGFAIVPGDGHALDVLVADPEQPLELGPFAGLDEALHGIAAWLALPRDGWSGRA